MYTLKFGKSSTPLLLDSMLLFYLFIQLEAGPPLLCPSGLSPNVHRASQSGVLETALDIQLCFNGFVMLKTLSFLRV